MKNINIFEGNFSLLNIVTTDTHTRKCDVLYKTVNKCWKRQEVCNG